MLVFLADTKFASTLTPFCHFCCLTNMAVIKGRKCSSKKKLIKKRSERDHGFNKQLLSTVNTEKLETKMGVVGKKRTEMITTDKDQCKHQLSTVLTAARQVHFGDWGGYTFQVKASFGLRRLEKTPSKPEKKPVYPRRTQMNLPPAPLLLAHCTTKSYVVLCCYVLVFFLPSSYNSHSCHF